MHKLLIERILKMEPTKRPLLQHPETTPPKQTYSHTKSEMKVAPARPARLARQVAGLKTTQLDKCTSIAWCGYSQSC
jgi:hypothetical protein